MATFEARGEGLSTVHSLLEDRHAWTIAMAGAAGRRLSIRADRVCGREAARVVRQEHEGDERGGAGTAQESRREKLRGRRDECGDLENAVRQHAVVLGSAEDGRRRRLREGRREGGDGSRSGREGQERRDRKSVV